MNVASITSRLQIAYRDSEGQALAEYAFILALVFVGVIGALALLGGAIVQPIQAFVDGVAGSGSGS
jgi:Flp pilus assembly pilin Flp